eukprot:SAG22_NODE_1757_length_3650_cov_2.473669_3_plen_339_part_00
MKAAAKSRLIKTEEPPRLWRESSKQRVPFTAAGHGASRRRRLELAHAVSCKALPLCCASTAFLSKTAPFLAVCLSSQAPDWQDYQSKHNLQQPAAAAKATQMLADYHRRASPRPAESSSLAAAGAAPARAGAHRHHHAATYAPPKDDIDAGYESTDSEGLDSHDTRRALEMVADLNKLDTDDPIQLWEAQGEAGRHYVSELHRTGKLYSRLLREAPHMVIEGSTEQAAELLAVLGQLHEEIVALRKEAHKQQEYELVHGPPPSPPPTYELNVVKMSDIQALADGSLEAAQEVVRKVGLPPPGTFFDCIRTAAVRADFAGLGLRLGEVQPGERCARARE